MITITESLEIPEELRTPMKTKDACLTCICETCEQKETCVSCLKCGTVKIAHLICIEQ